MPGADIPLALASSSSPNRVRQVGDARLINAKAEKTEQGRSAFSVYPREGLRRVATLDGGPIRGLFEVDEARAYALAGTKLHQFGPTGAARLLGAIAGEGPAYFARNRRPATQVVCVSGGAASLIQASGITPLRIPGPSGGAISPIDCCFIDGYLVFITRAGQMHFTGIDNAETTSALNFLTAEGNPDGLWRCVNRKREIWLFGDRTTEIFVASGDVDTPFQRLGGGFIETGIMAPDSLQHGSDRLVWVDDNGRVKAVAQGYQDQRISTHAVERAIQDEPNKRSMRSLSYVLAGHDHYVLTGTAFSWDFDFVTGTWTERVTEGMERWRAACAVDFAQTTFAGDLDTGNLYEISENAFTDHDRDIVMTLRLPTVSAFPKALVFYNARVDVTTGIGGGAGEPSEDVGPHLRLRWSDDDGRSWSPYRRALLGGHGATRAVRFNQLGQSAATGRTFELSMSAAKDRAFAAATVNVAQVSNP